MLIYYYKTLLTEYIPIPNNLLLYYKLGHYQSMGFLVHNQFDFDLVKCF